MKETYTKPRIHVERFALSQSIASSCTGSPGQVGGTVNLESKYACGYLIGGLSYWLDAMNTCMIKLGPDDSIGNVCYDNPTAGFTVFSS